MWDEEVDVVCVGGAIGGLASAIVAVDAGVDVFVAASAIPYAARRTPISIPHDKRRDRGWLSDRVMDDETNEYFAALSSDLAPLNPLHGDIDLPTRVVHELSHSERKGRGVEPFFGARLRDWAAQCLTSPYGLLHTRASDWQTTTMRTIDGDAIEVKVVGALETADDAGGTLLVDWLVTEARARDIEVCAASPLQRIVFEDGEVVGAVIATPEGPYAVRARHGVTVAPGDEQAEAAGRRALRDSNGSVQVCLVSRSASRFGRLELLTTEPAVIRRPGNCHSINRQLHHSLNETRLPRSEAGRWRKVHRNPPFGE